MDVEKKDHLHRLLEIYQKELLRRGFFPFQGGMALSHCSWMVQEMVNRVAQDQVDEGKANRWLGFVQGVMWREGFFSIDQLRQHVKN